MLVGTVEKRLSWPGAVVNIMNRTQHLTVKLSVLQFELCGVQGDKLARYKKGLFQNNNLLCTVLYNK